MSALKPFFIIAYFGVFCMGVERNGWPGYEYEADIQGWLKMHLEPADWYTAKATCHSEDAILASPWPQLPFTRTVTRLQASKYIPKMYAGAGVTTGSRGVPMEINENKRCVVFLATGTTDKEICFTQLPYACYAPAPSCENGYDFHSETEHCYKMHKQSKYMKDVISTCKSEGAYLAKLDGGYKEQKLLSKIVRDTGKIISYIANDDGGPQRHMFENKYEDYPCTEEHSFICEKDSIYKRTIYRD